MCKFCDNTDWNSFNVVVRSTYADDNVCEKLSPDGCGGSECEGCKGCADENNKFTLTLNCRGINLGYIHKIRDTNIMPFSEGIHINYCPFCGRQIEKDIIEFDDIMYISHEKEDMKY